MTSVYDRILRLRRFLSRRKIDAFLISHPDNRRYLSGFSPVDHSITEPSGFLLILRQGTSKLLTDFRYQIQAERDAAGFDIVLYKRGLLQLLKKILPQLGVNSLAFEANYILHSKYIELSKLGSTLGLRLVPLDHTIEQMRLIKTTHELDLMERSLSLNEAVFQQVLPSIIPGLTERQIAQMIENTMHQMGAERPSFNTIVASGPNSALPHAEPGERKLQAGEPIIIDMGVVLSGYCSDMTRTIVLGTPDQQTISLFRLVRQAQLAGLSALRPGVMAKDVDHAARTVIVNAGYGANFGHSLGHGVGLAVHESPSLNARNRKTLRPGMVVTVEPGVYIRGWGGIRLENMAVVTKAGHRVLNQDLTFLEL